MATKPEMITMPAHPTNTWDRYGTNFEFIVMHYVGAVSTAKNNGQYYGNTPNLRASAHFFVDEHDIVASVPLNRAAGHCGVDYSGGKASYWNTGAYSTNKRSIGIEMCCKIDSRGNWYIEPATVTRTVGLVKWLMQEYNIDVDHVVRHYDVCWKICPEPWVRDLSQWTSFKKRLTEEEIDMTEVRLREIIQEELKKIAYGDISTVPDYWEGALQKLLDLKTVDGGTLASVNDHDVNMTKMEAKVLAVFVRTFDAVLPGAIEAAIERLKEEQA